MINMHLHKYYKMKKLKIVLYLALFTTLFTTACSKEETDNTNNTTSTLTGPQDTVTSFMVYFTNTVDSVTEVGSYDDPDGPGPRSANIGGVVLKKNASYIVTFMIEDATGKSKVFLHNKIKTYGKDYKICISNPLGISTNAIDSDGTMPIGLVNDLLTTSSTGSGTFNFTIKYQKGCKNGSCSPGSVYYTCNLPVYVN